ncbi:MAG TPA: TIGR02677 family protein [Clostridiales bacterium]|nr:MAG: TIGR02677 family protein [Clostridiales bacterium GWD2_32_59]HAN09327.1 TIGR02677 family protein [Clostridiales bacterium]
MCDSVEINGKVTKQIVEVKYLVEDNAYRYRTIIRFLFTQYEKIKYWFYKEEIYEELKKHDVFREYTMDMCLQDLEALVRWGNIVPVQDTSRVQSIDEFKNKKFRYRLSEYTVEIERMTIKLENLFIEGASLEPTLIERLKQYIVQFDHMHGKSEKELSIWWDDLNISFKRLNQNYQDYIRNFQSMKADELLKSKEFIVYKDKFVEYLRDFIKSLQDNAHQIEKYLNHITPKMESEVILRLVNYKKSIPQIEIEVVTREQIRDNIAGVWDNIKEWFLGSKGMISESEKLLEITNDIIRKMTRYAVHLAESSRMVVNRKEEYIKIVTLFSGCKDIHEAHKLASHLFGIERSRHIKGNLTRDTESINSSIYEEKPMLLDIKPRIRAYRETFEKTVIRDNTDKKKEALEAYLEGIARDMETVNSYINEGILDFKVLPVIEKNTRKILLRWLAKALANTSKITKTEDGRRVEILNPDTRERCVLKSKDGELEMPGYVLEVRGERSEVGK